MSGELGAIAPSSEELSGAELAARAGVGFERWAARGPRTHAELAGVTAGPVIGQGGDYFERTVNLASRIADHACGGQVLVSEPVVAMTSVAGVRFAGMGAIELPGLTSPIRDFQARRS